MQFCPLKEPLGGKETSMKDPKQEARETLERVERDIRNPRLVLAQSHEMAA